MLKKSVFMCLLLGTWGIVLPNPLEVWRGLVTSSGQSNVTCHFLVEPVKCFFMILQLFSHLATVVASFQMVQLPNSGASICLEPQVVLWKGHSLES